MAKKHQIFKTNPSPPPTLLTPPKPPTLPTLPHTSHSPLHHLPHFYLFPRF
ncbi:MAG: hypothetical protein F6J93_18335 [Oscillatoria sp. SIO1A7]|nr:hypothetical protein [Oscillatoria sp. SIO1A7]